MERKKVRTFEDLIVWQKAIAFVKRVYLVTNQGDLKRDFGLKDQIRRAAASIPTNIAEGFERKRASSFALFLEYSRGSCAELRAQLYLASDAGWLEPAELERLMSLAGEVARMLGALHRSQSGHQE